jgi:hypothetical protein
MPFVPASQTRGRAHRLPSSSYETKVPLPWLQGVIKLEFTQPSAALTPSGELDMKSPDAFSWITR